MALITGIHHIALKCCSIEEYEKTVAFYRDILQMPVVRSWPTGSMLHTGNGVMEITTAGDVPKEEGAIRHFALATQEVDTLIERCRAAGYTIQMEPRDIVIASEPPLPARIGFVVGPAGEEIEFFWEK